jgi:hypothetical protein
MKKEEALKLIKGNEKKPKFTGVKGFMVHFELRKDHMLHTDYFPEKHLGEDLIRTEEDAWNLAKRFSLINEDYVNIYVIDHNFQPVSGYKTREIKEY